MKNELFKSWRHYLEEHYDALSNGETFCVFTNATIQTDNDLFLIGTHVSKEIFPSEGETYPYTNFHKQFTQITDEFKFQYQSKSNLSLKDATLTIENKEVKLVSIEDDSISEVEIAVYATRFDSYECGRLLIEHFKSPEKIKYTQYPKKIRQHLKDSIDWYFHIENDPREDGDFRYFYKGRRIHLIDNSKEDISLYSNSDPIIIFDTSLGISIGGARITDEGLLLGHMNDYYGSEISAYTFRELANIAYRYIKDDLKNY